jgi:hypothetical protein
MNRVKNGKHPEWRRATLLGTLLVLLLLAVPLTTAATIKVHLIKYAVNESILNEKTVNYTWMNLSVQGDEITTTRDLPLMRAIYGTNQKV